MKILGIDYGKSKIGLATSEGVLASPWKVVKPDEIKKIIKEGDYDKIVVGVSEGEMGKESEKFAKSIGAVTFDETLSTFEAQQFSRQAGISTKKRKNMEDAYAATIMLQNYLDSSATSSF